MKKIFYVFSAIKSLSILLILAENVMSAEILVDPSFIKMQNLPFGVETKLIGIEDCFSSCPLLKIINNELTIIEKLFLKFVK